MVTLINNGDSSTKFVFTNSSHYLYGDGEITVPINSLSLVIDNSEMVTFKKASCGDPFISFRADDSNLGTKEAIEAFYKEYMVGDTGGADPEEIEAIVESALTPVYADITSIQDDIDEKEEVVATALNELKDAADVTAAALAQLNGGLEILREDYYETVNDLQGDVADIQADIADVEDSVTALETDVAEVQANMGGIKLQKIYESDYEALAEKDGNTLYIIVEDPDYSAMYFTIKSLEDNNEITLKSNSVLDMSVSTDDGATWSAVTASSEGTVMATLNNGDKLLLKGNNTTVWDNLWDAEGIIGSTGQFNIYGNVMSLLYGDNFIGATSVGRDALNRAFAGCTGLISAKNLVLPATTLAYSCYFSMFEGCTSLTTAPELPATTLSDWCYYGMFAGCTSLTTAPELPATTLASRCYCVMFAGCTSLNYIKMLATDISASECLNYWVQNVASTGTFVKNAAMTTLPTGIHGIPSGWTVQDAA